MNRRFLVGILFIGALTLKERAYGNTAFTGMRDITALELARDMESGWNLGNTLDAVGDDETAWGLPRTTQAMINAIRSRGFKTIRLPVTWQTRMNGAPDYTIDADWLDRVEQVANYAFSVDMYVIINIHHDDEWIVPTEENKENVKNILTKVWTQIATRFKDYGDYLIFETINEPRLKGHSNEWNGGTQESRLVINELHQTCIDAIRSAGANNASRFLLISPYAASTQRHILDDFVVPDDERVMISLHSYFPFEFTLLIGDGEDHTWGTDEDKAAMDAEFQKIHDEFIAKGRAVVMTEWSATNRNNPDDRLAHTLYYSRKCANIGIPPVFWDNGYEEGSGIFDRRNLSWWFPELADAVVLTVREVYGITDPIDVILSVENHGTPLNNVIIFNTSGVRTLGITYSLGQSARVAMEILDIYGRSIKQLINTSWQPEGTRTINWDGRNDSGARVPSGLYILQAKSQDTRQTYRLLLK